MKKSILCVLSVAAVLGTALTSTAASAAVKANPPAGSDPDTTVTFAVTSGLLTMTAPAAAFLGSGAPGDTITGAAGAVTVTDARALLAASWIATASSTDFTTGTGTPDETIPAGDATYTPGTVTTTDTTGRVTNVVPTQITLSATPQNVVTLTAVGNNTATWDPTIAVDVPASAVTGTYTATLVQSVTGGGGT